MHKLLNKVTPDGIELETVCLLFFQYAEECKMQKAFSHTTHSLNSEYNIRMIYKYWVPGI